ncbi:hypothetical protein Q31b_38390 [Novipirellula aureliae]|uniref:Exostosin family protein n=1 Tax=Novipirellula aureliae TaxID=2527966 RepID=A0A5C6DTD0_9BACT|nr:hypothetical protein Q31b_38390 [Novipirellula aureliae]
MGLKNVLRFPADIRRARRLLANRSSDHAFDEISLNQRPIALDLHGFDMLFDCGRHLASLAHYSGEIGSRFYVRSSRLVLASISHKPYGARMLSYPHVTWLSNKEPLPNDALVLSDSDVSQHRSPGNNGRRLIEMLVGCDIPDGLPVMPYPMHPDTLSFLDSHSLGSHRKTKQRSGILFAGSQKTKYGRDKMQNRFGVLSRLHILDIIRDCCDNGLNGDVPVFLRNSAIEPVAAADWLSFLAQYQFFVCCPGVDQPLCHNLIESMSVGTIPLIEYGDRLRPKLEDGVNAICFQGESGLRQAIRRIGSMTKSEITCLSNNVAEHYDRHLAGDTFMKSLRDETIDVPFNQVAMPFHSENFYQGRQTSCPSNHANGNRRK